ncbi:unnamed protein product, partial [Laminaria digitata]
GNTPPSDLLQHIPHDALRADILSLGCGDLRDFLYSISLHGRRGASCGPVPRQLTCTLNDWEPAIHARNLVMLQLVLDSRNLLEPDSAGSDILDGQMEAIGVGDSPETSAQTEPNSATAVRRMTSNTDSEICNTKAGSRADPACSKALDQEHHAAFAQRIGVIFSAMYNVFVDPEVLQTIQDVAGRLASYASSLEGWHKTELGRLVHFADDRSQDRVRDILTLYADKSLRKRASAASVKKQRSAFISKRISKADIIASRSMGLAALGEDHNSAQAYSEMVHKYLTEGILDPFPLLLADKTAPPKRGPSKHANPLLLVTERKGTAYSLHYASFPLDAFNTEVASWKLRGEGFQDEHGKLAPRVLKKQAPNKRSNERGPSTASARRGVQDARFGVALEQLAQMCGGFLAATRVVLVGPRVSMTPATSYLRIIVHAGDAINFCDAMLTSLTTAVGIAEGGVGPGASSSSSPTLEGIAFQQGTLQPLRLRKDTLMGSRAQFDVISTSNLAEHLGVVNVLVATAPLLAPQPHAVLLTSFMASVGTLPLHKDIEAFYEKQLCMTSQAAALLLGVVPVSSLSSVVGHADTTSLLCPAGSKLLSEVGAIMASILRLTWKHPVQASTATDSASGPTRILGDISPSEFVDLTLPVYKAMFAHMPTTAVFSSGVLPNRNTLLLNQMEPKYYTSMSFGRLLALAGGQLRLKTAHFQAALHAIRDNSGVLLAPNLMQEQAALFHALGLAPIAQVSLSMPVDTRRVVLLVPASGLSLLREFNVPEVYLGLTGTLSGFDNHFVSVHMAFVRVRRGGSTAEDGTNDWRSLNRHLMVRDTREDDTDAELMVSAIIPTYALTLAPLHLTQLQLRPRDSAEMFHAPKDVMRRLGGMMMKCFYGADLANKDRTAILTPDENPWFSKGGATTPPLPCPKAAVSSRCAKDTPFPAAVSGGSGAPESPFLQRSKNGGSVIDQSLEVMSQPGRRTGAPLVCRVTLVMVNREARAHLSGGGGPRVEGTPDPCSVRVVLGTELVHVVRFPFPVISEKVRVVSSKSQGYAHFTVLPLSGLVEVPFALSASCNVEEDGAKALLLSTFCWSMCVPLTSLPRLDFNAEWAHNKVLGPMSAHNAERSSKRLSGGPHLGFLGMKESLLHIAASACATHNEDNPTWKHEWACITNTERHDEPTLWVWVNEILLDPSNQALVLDCCIMPVDSMLHEASLKLDAVVGGVATNLIKASHDELELWTALLPVAVERARQTYAHAPDCMYSIPSDASPTVCSCGMGKDLHPAFMESMKSVRALVGGAALTTLFYRAALSPLYAPPEMAAAKGTAMGSQGGSGVMCAKCGKGASSMLCSRCRKVTYCSKGCQREDWKKHKPECTAKSGSKNP